MIVFTMARNSKSESNSFFISSASLSLYRCNVVIDVWRLYKCAMAYRLIKTKIRNFELIHIVCVVVQNEEEASGT